MRLLILGSLNRPAVTQLAMDRGTTVTDAADIARTLAVLRAGRGADLLMVDVAVDIRALVRGLAADHIDIQHAAVAAEPVSRALVGRAVAEVERDLTLETLKHCLGNRTHAANVLGISIRTLSPIRHLRLLSRRIAAFDDDRLHLSGAGAAERGGFVVFVGLKAGDALFEGRKLDHHEALKLVRAFHHLVAPTAGQNLAAIFGDDGRHEVGIFFVVDRIVDLGARDPIGWH
jgi:hypothetical protein